MQPLGKPWFFDRGGDVFDAVGIESVFSEKALPGLESISGYCYADGTFDIEGTLELRGEQNELVSYSLRSVRKTSFDGVPRNIGDVDAYDQWNYTMADGTPVESVGNLDGQWCHKQGGALMEGFDESDVVTAEKTNAIIAQYPRMDVDFRPVEDFSKE